MLIIIGLFIILLSLPVLMLKKRFGKKKERSWSLTLDSPYFHSSKFDITDCSIEITGTQNTVHPRVPVRYSLVKMDRLGRSYCLGSAIKTGSFLDEDIFSITFSNIPIGSGYKIEVYSHHSLAHGEFTVSKGNQHKTVPISLIKSGQADI